MASMQQLSPILERNNRLMQDILYTSFSEQATYSHARSVFPDAYYNFIIPKVEHSHLDHGAVSELINESKEEGYEMSYYVHETLRDSYQSGLLDSEYYGDDSFVVSEISDLETTVSSNIESLKDEDFDAYIELAKSCFPDWDNEELYCRTIIGSGSEVACKKLQTAVVKDDGVLVAFGSVIIDVTQKLAYLHNLGTKKEYRNQGHFTNLVKYFCMEAAKEGTAEAYALVEKDGGSYRALSELGFETQETFHLFSVT